MQSFVGNFCNTVFATGLKFNFFAKMFCNNIGRQATTTSIQIHKLKIDVLQSHTSTGREAHFTSLGELKLLY
jgi:hypothetical protein